MLDSRQTVQQRPAGAPVVAKRGVADRLRVDPGHTLITIAADALAAILAVSAAKLWPGSSDIEYGWVPWLFVPTLLLLLASRSMYRRGLRKNFLDEIGPVETSVTMAAMLMLTLLLVLGTEYRAGLFMVHLWVSATLTLALARFLRTTIQRYLRTHNKSSAPTLIIGGGPIARQLATRMRQFPEYGLAPIGLLDKTETVDVIPDVPGGTAVPWLGTPSELEAAIRSTAAEELVIGFCDVPTDQLVKAVRTAHEHSMRVWLVPRLFDTVGGRARVEHLGGLPLMVLPHVDPKGWQFFVKGLMDRGFAAIGVLILSPVFLLLALLVRLSSPGPIFFSQERIGRDGKTFGCLKFRSMRPPRASDAAFERQTGAAPGGVEGVDRRTRIGKLMRQTSLDELPQLLNVVRGDMSLVGPRPERPEYVDLFAMQIRRYGERHRVKAGVTGWAQVHGLRGQTSIADRAEWDNYYIENWSLTLDLKILFLTIAAVLKKAED
ncbi:MAG: sugar transferase [Rhodococcus sp. (in: high G+C Gram-positive bacteria)]